MKTFTRLMLAGLIALFLAACGQDAGNGGDGTGGDGTGGQPGNEAEYEGVFFKVVEEDEPHNVIVGTTDLTLSNGQVSGTLTAYSDSEDFPNDTGSISGTYQEAGMQGDKQVYTADLQLNFDSAPDYTASSRFYTVAGKIFTEDPMALSKDGTRVGKFILAEDDDNGDDNGDNPQPGNPSGDGQYDDTFFKTVEEVAPNTVIVGTGDLTLSNGQLSGTLTAYGDSEDFPNATGNLSGTVTAGQTYGEKQSYTADLQIDFDGDAPDYTASGRVYTVNRTDEGAKIFTEQPMVLSKDGAQVGKFILAEQD